MLVMEHIAELIGNAGCLADDRIHIIMGMTIHPEVNVTLFDEVLQLYGEGSVGLAVLELRTLHAERRHVVSNHNLVFGIALGQSIFDECQATLMFTIEVGMSKNVSVIENPSEVSYVLLGIVGFLEWNLCPKGGYDKIHITYSDHGIIIAVHIGTDFQTIAILEGCDVVILVELVVTHAGYHLLVVLRCPVPERVLAVVVIAKITDVASQYEYVARHFQGILLEVSPVLGKLKMQVGSILYSHYSEMKRLFSCSSNASMKSSS
jgi:hypothetical protein